MVLKISIRWKMNSLGPIKKLSANKITLSYRLPINFILLRIEIHLSLYLILQSQNVCLIELLCKEHNIKCSYRDVGDSFWSPTHFVSNTFCLQQPSLTSSIVHVHRTKCISYAVCIQCPLTISMQLSLSISSHWYIN